MNLFVVALSKETLDLLSYEHRINSYKFLFVDKLVSIRIRKIQTLLSLKLGILGSTTLLINIKF